MKGPKYASQVAFFSVYILMVCGCASASSKDAPQTNEFSEKCGISLTLPDELVPDGQGKLQTCTGSYKATGGTVLSLAPIYSGVRDSSWIDRIPMLHIRRIGIDEVIKKNEGGIFHRASTGKAIVSVSALMECKLKVKTTITKIAGTNWHGWLAEDSYNPAVQSTSLPEYCQRYSAANRCVRVVIGNSKESATMSQYCLIRNPGGFDLDAGLSYDIFIKIVKSIHFTENSEGRSGS